MQNEVIAKIDALAKMSDSTASVNTLKVELKEIECAIKEKKLDLKELKSSINDDKYFDASGEIVDKNIEIFLSKKIKTVKKSLADLENQLEKITLEESKAHDELEKKREEWEESKNFLEVLSAKMATANGSDNFRKLYEETDEKSKNLKKEIKKQEKNYEKIQGKLEVISFSRKELQNKLDSETEKLIDVKANLLNKRGYTNLDAKQEDQDAVEKLEKDLAALTEEKNKILSEPVMIAEDAKMYLIDDDKTSALKKIRELKDVILEQPYMDVLSNRVDSLEIELENSEAKRDEFASMIHSKNYESVDTTLIKDRITYITAQKEHLEDEIKNIKNKIKEIDNNELEDLSNRINYCENEVEILKDKLNEYEETLASEDIQITKKAALQASLDKKKEELENVLELLSAYRNDRKALINRSYDLEEKEIKGLNDKIAEINEEIKRLEKISLSTNKTKDTIAMENDKKTLKDLNETIKAIKKRQSLKSSPIELYDEIEVLLGIETGDSKVTEEVEETSESIAEPVEIEVNEVEETEPIEVEIPEIEEEKALEITPIDLTEEVVNEEIKDSEETKEEVTIENLEEESNTPEDLVLEPVIEDIEPVEITPAELSIQTIDLDSLKPIEEEEVEITDINNESEEKIKVINVEPLNSDNNTEQNSTNDNTSEDSEFLIGDYIV